MITAFEQTYLVAVLLTATLSAHGEPDLTAPEDVAFAATSDQSTQHYVVMRPDPFDGNAPLDVLIALHGHGSDRWQFAKNPRDECRAARDAAAKHGMLFVSPDYRAETSWMGPSAEADMVQIIDELKSAYCVRRVFVCGGSMGGTAALTFATRHPELVDGVASMNGTANLVEYERFQDAFRESYGGTKTEVPDEYRSRSAEFFPERLTMPVGITTGGKDEIVPPQSVLRLVEALKAMQRDVLLIHREDGGHETNYMDATTILDFVIREATNTIVADKRDAGPSAKRPRERIRHQAHGTSCSRATRRTR